MDGAYGMLADVFYQILAKTLPTTGVEAQGAPRQLPFNVLPWSAEVHLAIFVHRVVGLEPGIYLLVRNEAHMKDLRKATKNEFEWEKPDNCPPSLPLYMLHPGDVQDLATRLSCNQVSRSQYCVASTLFSNVKLLLQFKIAQFKLYKTGAPSYHNRVIQLYDFWSGVSCFVYDTFHVW